MKNFLEKNLAARIASGVLFGILCIALMIALGDTYLAGLSIFFTLYFLPTIIASDRKHRQRIPIGILNAFLGWTFIGWVAALIWAFTSDIDGDLSDIRISR